MATKKTAPKKTTAKKAVAKKAVAKKAVAKKAVAKKAVAKKAVAKKAAEKSAPAKKAAEKNPVAKAAVGKKAAAEKPVAKIESKQSLVAMLDDETPGSEPAEMADINVVLAAEEGAEWSEDSWIEDEDDELKVPGFEAVDEADEIDGSDDEIVVKPKKKAKVILDDDDEELDELLVKGVGSDEVACTGCYLIVQRWRIADTAATLCRDCA